MQTIHAISSNPPKVPTGIEAFHTRIDAFGGDLTVVCKLAGNASNADTVSMDYAFSKGDSTVPSMTLHRLSAKSIASRSASAVSSLKVADVHKISYCTSWQAHRHQHMHIVESFLRLQSKPSLASGLQCLQQYSMHLPDGQAIQLITCNASIAMLGPGCAKSAVDALPAPDRQEWGRMCQAQRTVVPKIL